MQQDEVLSRTRGGIMTPEKVKGLVGRMSTAERIEAAKAKTKRVVDHLLYLLELHENNRITLYSDTLSAQIPKSFAANAFNVFQQALHQFEIVRLCALWDGPDPDGETIPTVAALIDHPDVIESLAQETLSHWRDIPTHKLNPSSDPELRAIEEDGMQRVNLAFGEEQAQRARDDLRQAIADADTLFRSPQLQSIRNLRHKHLAHSLSQTRLERIGPVALMKYGDEQDVLEASIPIVENLYCWVNGCSFSFEESQQIDRKHAEALWKGCKFDVLG